MFWIEEDHIDKHGNEFKVDPEVPVLFLFKINET
jgi:hypothetical protein